MSEASENYVWSLDDKIGSGATSIVYKAYNMKTGAIAAAKVSKVERRGARIIPTNSDNPAQPSIFDREIQFLKDINHPNIIRFIGIEMVSLRNDSAVTQSREVLFLEFCNGGSLTDVLQRPINRFGLPEDTILQIVKDVISGLKYLYDRNIIHRDIKPDNILQSIEINGKISYKLADLGVARRINPDELSTDSICGTVEFVHPIVFNAYLNNIKMRSEGKRVTSRPRFPFEVEMWAFGVTIYQCATGRIPFQPYEGTRADQNTMQEILNSIPSEHISGIQTTPKGTIEWSKHLPDWCRLSSNLKEMLEKLLARLFETDHAKLMRHEEFYNEIEKILSFVPIYYLNLKRLTSTCTYIHKDQPINELIDKIRKENDDDENIEYFCLFQNVHYPISKNNPISVKTFYEQLPVEPSNEKLLVFYTYSTLKLDAKPLPKVNIPEIQPTKKIHDVFYSDHEWSKNIVGHLFYVKNQLMEYEFILQITQSSITTINRSLKLNLCQLLCQIRTDLVNHQAIYELDEVACRLGMIDHTLKIADQSIQEPTPKKKTKSIIKTIEETKQSKEQIHRALQVSIDFYRQLKEYDRDLSNISHEYFNDELKSADDEEAPFNTYRLLKQIASYSKNIQRIDKYIDAALDLSDKFRRDTFIDRATSLHMLSHSIRKMNLTELQSKFVQLVHQECYPIIVEIFSKYRHWIQLQEKIHASIEAIQASYQQHANKIVSIADLRTIINQELKKLNTNDQMTMINSFEIPLRETFMNKYNCETASQSSRTTVNDIAGNLQQAIRSAQTNSMEMNEAIRKLQQLLQR